MAKTILHLLAFMFEATTYFNYADNRFRKEEFRSKVSAVQDYLLFGFGPLFSSKRTSFEIDCGKALKCLGCSCSSRFVCCLTPSFSCVFISPPSLPALCFSNEPNNSQAHSGTSQCRKDGFEGILRETRG